MTHSHLPVQHLLKQVEDYRTRRAERDIRPDWLTAMIDDVAELFEPLHEVGRVGFDCQMTEACWLVRMYLGGVEIVGGKDDGRTRQPDFQFDLLEVLEQFDSVDHFCWSAVPQQSLAADAVPCSTVTIDGSVDNQRIRLQLCSSPPNVTGPGLREYPGGRMERV